MDNVVGVSAAIIALLSIARLLLSDHSLRQDMKDMKGRMEKMEVDNKEQHHLKHQAIQEQVKYQMLLGTIIVLAEDCSCGALDKVQSFMDRLDPTTIGTGTPGPIGPQGPPGPAGPPAGGGHGLGWKR